MIRTSALTKRYGAFVAVDDLDLDVAEGDVYGLLGANGSGKTTTVRMLLGLVLATSGTIEVLGRKMPRHAADVLPDVGALVEGPAAYGHLSGRANLALTDASGRRSDRRTRARRVEEVLDRVGLGGIDQRPVRTYSLGMRQRLGLASALLSSPRLLVLDEPTNGLDPVGIREMRALIHELNANGTTILMLSHQLSEVERVCSRVGVLDRGRMVLEQELAALRQPTGRFHLESPEVPRVRELLGDQAQEPTTTGVMVQAEDAAALTAHLVAAGVPVAGLTAERVHLEDLVLRATTSSADRFERR